jgi:hypothetical protein
MAPLPCHSEEPRRSPGDEESAISAPGICKSPRAVIGKSLSDGAGGSLGTRHIEVPRDDEDRQPTILGHRSCQSRFPRSMSAIFFARDQLFSCFSRSIAATMSWNGSKWTS